MDQSLINLYLYESWPRRKSKCSSIFVPIFIKWQVAVSQWSNVIQFLERSVDVSLVETEEFQGHELCFQTHRVSRPMGPEIFDCGVISGCFFDDFVDFCGPLMSETHRLQFVHFRRRSVLRGLWELRWGETAISHLTTIWYSECPSFNSNSRTWSANPPVGFPARWLFLPVGFPKCPKKNSGSASRRWWRKDMHRRASPVKTFSLPPWWICSGGDGSYGMNFEARRFDWPPYGWNLINYTEIILKLYYNISHFPFFLVPQSRWVSNLDQCLYLFSLPLGCFWFLSSLVPEQDDG